MLRRYYDRIEVTASAGGIGALDLHLLQPTPVPTSPLPYAPLLNIARTSAGVQLIPIDPVLAASEAERGVPRLRCLEPAVFV